MEEQTAPSRATPEDAPPDSTSANGALAFEEVEVRRMHGVSFDGLALTEISPRVNLVHGPNAAGKTTLARGLARALWPEEGRETRGRLTAAYRMNGDIWTVRVDAGIVELRREGREGGSPPLPPAELQSRYYLHLTKLLRAEDTALAEEVLRQAAGGYDVEAAASALGSEVNTPTRRIAEAQEVNSARKDVREVRGKQDELEQEQRRRGELEQQRSEAQEARRRVTLLEQAKEYAEAREALREAKAKLDSFPDVLAKMQGDEDEKLAGLREGLDVAKGDKAEAQANIDKAEPALSKSRIPREDGVPDECLRVLDARVSRLEHLEDRQRRIEGELKSAGKRAERTWERIEGEIAEEQAENLVTADVREVAIWARRAEQVRLKQKQLDILRELIGGDGPEHDPDQLREGYRLLARWLRSAAGIKRDETPLQAVRWIVWILAVVLAAGGAAAGLLGHPVGWGAVAIGIVAVAAAEYRIRRAETPVDRSSGTYRRDYEELDLAAPAAWDAEAVAGRLDELVQGLADAMLESEKREMLRQQEAQTRDLDEQERALEERRTKLVRDVGLAPPLEGEADEAVLYAFVDTAVEWQKARDEVEARRAEQAATEKQIEKTLDKMNDALAVYELDADDGDAARAAVQTLRDDVRDFEKHREMLERAQDDKSEAQKRIQDVEDEIDKLLDELDADRRREVEELCEEHSNYGSAVGQRRKAKTKLEVEQEKLEEHAGFQDDLLDRPIGEIENQLYEAEKQADQVEGIQKQINEINTLIKQAMAGRDLEKARADYERALDALHEKRRSDERRAIGRGLADFVLEETKSTEMPGVFERAQELFVAITNGQYELDVDPQGGFDALDSRDGRRYALDALSSGTRVQLILAVRMAFVERQEPAGTKLPVVFDETLANSDDRRARAIIEGIARLAQAGRQVFYLSAQADEIGKWKEVLEDESIPYQVHVLDGASRGSDRQERVSVNLPDPRGALPDPEETTHEELEELLEVPAWHPRDHIGNLHLWYVVDDPAVLVELVRSGIELWGQLRALDQGGAAGAVGMAEDAFERCRALAEAVGAWSEAWTVGRGRLVDRAVLEDSDAVSNKFIDEATTKCEEVGNSAEELIAALRRSEVSGFWSNKTDELEEYFLNEGYLDPQDPLSDEDLWSRALGGAQNAIKSNFITSDHIRAALRRLGSRKR